MPIVVCPQCEVAILPGDDFRICEACRRNYHLGHPCPAHPRARMLTRRPGDVWPSRVAPPRAVPATPRPPGVSVPGLTAAAVALLLLWFLVSSVSAPSVGVVQRGSEAPPSAAPNFSPLLLRPDQVILPDAEMPLSGLQVAVDSGHPTNGFGRIWRSQVGDYREVDLRVYVLAPSVLASAQMARLGNCPWTPPGQQSTATSAGTETWRFSVAPASSTEIRIGQEVGESAKACEYRWAGYLPYVVYTSAMRNVITEVGIAPRTGTTSASAAAAAAATIAFVQFRILDRLASVGALSPQAPRAPSRAGTSTSSPTPSPRPTAPPVTQPPATPPPDSGFHARYFSESSFLQATRGQVFEFAIGYENVGSRPWRRGVVGEQAILGTASPLSNTTAAAQGWSVNWPSPAVYAVQSTDLVAPQQVGFFVFRVRVPANAPLGLMRFYMRPAIEGVQWMEDQGAYFVLSVVQTPVPTPPPTPVPTQTPRPTVASYASVASDRATTRVGESFGVAFIGFPAGWETYLVSSTDPNGKPVPIVSFDSVPIRLATGTYFTRSLRFDPNRGPYALGTYTLRFLLNSVPYDTTIKLVQ